MEPDRRTQTLVFVALAGLSGLTLGLSFAPLGAAAAPVALTIAAAKAVLIALFFMHLVEQRSVNALAAVVAVVLVALFIGIAAGEVATREDRPDTGPTGAARIGGLGIPPAG